MDCSESLYSHKYKSDHFIETMVQGTMACLKSFPVMCWLRATIIIFMVVSINFVSTLEIHLCTCVLATDDV